MRPRDARGTGRQGIVENIFTTILTANKPPLKVIGELSDHFTDTGIPFEIQYIGNHDRLINRYPNRKERSALSATRIGGKKGVLPMIIYVFDTRWPGKLEPSILHSSKDRVEHFTVNPRVSIVNIARAVAGLSEGKGSIWMLRLCAHGNSGFLELGQGLSANSAQFLRFLKGYFTPGGPGIEIHGCATGSSREVRSKWFGLSCTPGQGEFAGNGYMFLRAIADATGARTRGALNCQHADDEFKWEGSTLTVDPGGSAIMGGTFG